MNYQPDILLLKPIQPQDKRKLLIKKRRHSLLVPSQPKVFKPIITSNFTQNFCTAQDQNIKKSVGPRVQKLSLSQSSYKSKKSFSLKSMESKSKATKVTKATRQTAAERTPSSKTKGISVIRKLKQHSSATASSNTFQWSKGDIAQKRYEFVDILGKGTFGTVFKGYDHLKKQEVAIKVIRPQHSYRQMAQTEINILVTVRQKDPKDQRSIVRIKDFFNFRGHMCITFQLLSINLYEMLRMINFKGMPIDVIRKIAIQLLTALTFLKGLGVIHGDIKPQNVVLKQFNKTGIKLIDFGTSMFESDRHYDYLMSRYYRAPQIILGCPYDQKIDLWSVGCVLVELLTGKPLFSGDSQQQQIGYFVQTLGIPNEEFLNNCQRSNKYFAQGSIRPEVSIKGRQVQVGSNTLSKIIDNKEFQTFICKLICWNSADRTAAEQLLEDSWILQGFPQQLLPQHTKNVKKLKQAIYHRRNLAMNKTTHFTAR